MKKNKLVICENLCNLWLNFLCLRWLISQHENKRTKHNQYPKSHILGLSAIYRSGTISGFSQKQAIRKSQTMDIIPVFRARAGS